VKKGKGVYSRYYCHVSKILVVDDQIDFTLQIKARLEKEGHEVYVSGSGRDALRQLITDCP